MREKALVEAALFMSNEPLPAEKLSKITKIRLDKVRKIVEELQHDYEKEDHGVRIVESSAGYIFRIKPEYSQNVSGLTPYKDLSRGLLRVLALVAYRQSITQSDIVKIIGNRAYDYVKKLEEKGLIRTVKQGRTKSLVPTKEFSDYFGLSSPEEIKKLVEGKEHNEEKKEEPE